MKRPYLHVWRPYRDSTTGRFLVWPMSPARTLVIGVGHNNLMHRDHPKPTRHFVFGWRREGERFFS